MPSPAHFRGTVAAIVDQPDDLRELRVFHKALADVNRLRIVRRLGEGPATVGDLIDTVGLSQPLVSWHVSRLKAAGIVETKRAGREVQLPGRTIRITGMAKGAAMIGPNMATMLALIMTDAAMDPATVQAVLHAATSDSFNCISVDGHMSTNDTVLLLANGAAGGELLASRPTL